MSSLIPTKIYEVLNAVVNGDIENFEVSVAEGDKKDEGFTGQISFVSLRNKHSGNQLHVVVKQARSDEIRETTPIRNLFFNEIYIYTDLLPEFLKLQERIPGEYHFHHVPKCLAFITKDNFERIAFENLNYQGYSLHDKTKAFSMENFEEIFKVYAKFHAMSFAYKTLNPVEFSGLTKKVVDVWTAFTYIKFFTDVIKLTHQYSFDALQKGVDDEIMEKYKHYIDDGVELLRSSLVDTKYSCLVHGDSWSNNMMFRYDQDSGKIIDLRLLDFQNVRIGSPVCDLSYCLYSGGTKEVFDHLDHLLQVYHGTLSENLTAYGCNPEEVYPLKSLKNDWKLHSQLGLIMGLMLWKMKLTYDKDPTDIATDQGNVLETQYDTKTFQERARDILRHFHENDML